MLDFTQPETLQTRSGRPIRIYATEGGGHFPIHGAWQNENGVWNSAEWTLEGTRSFPPTTEIESKLDLVQVKPRIKRVIWMNIYENREVCHPTEEQAKRDRSPGCLGCIEEKLDFEEGAGL